MNDSRPDAEQPRSPPRWYRVTAWWVAWRWVGLLIAVLVAAAAWPLSAGLRYDRSIENMFAPGDPIVATYREFKRVFGGNQIVLAVYEDPQLWTPSGLKRIDRVTTGLGEVTGVRDVLSLSVLDKMLRRLHSSVLDDRPLAREYREVFTGYTHNEQGDVVAIVCLLDDMPMAGPQMQHTVRALRAIMQEQELANGGVLVGEPVMVSDGFRYVEQDARWLGWLSAGLLAMTIILCLRSMRWVVISLLVVHWTILVTKAVLALTDLRLTMVSSMLTAVATVIGIATVMHLAVAIRDHQARGLRPETAVVQSLGILFLPILWACITDAIGFLSLLIADVGPVRDFGIMMAIAAVVVIPAMLLIVPPLALLGTRPGAREAQSRGARRLEAALARLARVVLHHPRPVWFAVAIISIVGAIGMQRVEVETDFTKNFRRSSPIARAYDFVETRLGGAGVWDIMLPAPAMLTEDYISRVRSLQQRLRALRRSDSPGRPALTKVLSVVDALDAASTRPLLAAMPVELRVRGMNAMMPDFIGALRGEDPQTGQPYVRIMLRAADRREAKAKQQLIARVEQEVRRAFADDRDSTVVTGYFVLLTNLVVSMLRDQWLCFIATVVGVGVMLAIALGRIGWAVAALISNAFPILVPLGALGFLDLKLNMGAAMIAAVSMGLSVDSSIHYLYAYRRARRAGSSVALALGEAQQTVGRAMVFATLALMLGFSALAASQFVPTIYFGVLGSLALFGGLIGNLILLPLLLRWDERYDRRSEQPFAAPAANG